MSSCIVLREMPGVSELVRDLGRAQALGLHREPTVEGPSRSMDLDFGP